MSDELLPLLAKMSVDIGEIKGLVTGVKETIANHVHQDELVQMKIFDRLNTLEMAHATTVGKGLAIKSIAAGLGAAGGGLGAIIIKFWPFHH